MIEHGLGWLNLTLLYATLAIRAFAFIDALVRPAPAFEAAGKLTKGAWLLILGLGLAIGLIGISGLVGLLTIAAMVAAIIYIVDVRPAVRQLGGRPGRSSNDGPYGSW